METSQTKQTKSIPLSEVAFDPSIYPRDSPDNVLISKYRDAVDHLPPIVIDRKNRIIDGYHRWQAMIAEGITECDFILFDSDNDRECLMESIRLNATHGKQLTQKEKKEIAVRLYIQGIADDEIRKIISISERTVRNYLYEVREKERDTRLQLIKDYWTKGLSIRNIAERVHLSKSQVENVVSTFGKVAEIGQSIEPMIRQSYLNYWESEERLHEKPNHLPLFAIETAIYFFTGRGDVVYDAGDSLDLWATCEKFNRRYVQKGKMNDVTSVDLIVLDYNWSEIGNAELLKDRIKNDIREIPVNELTRIVYTVENIARQFVKSFNVVIAFLYLMEKLIYLWACC